MLSQRTKGYIAGAVASCSYGLNPLMAVPLFAMGMASYSMLFYRYIFAAIILGMIMIATRKSLRLERRQIPRMLIYGLLFSCSSLLLFESYRYIDVGIASTLLFMYPVIVALINRIFFKERLSAITALAILLALGGVTLLYFGGGKEGGTLNLTGVLYVVASSLSYAIYMVAINRSDIRTLPSSTLTFYSIFFGLILYVIFIIRDGGAYPLNNLTAWTCVIGLALFPTILSILTMAVAIHNIGSTATAILGALEPLTGLAIGIVVFNEQLTAMTVAGIIMILTAVLMLILAAPAIRILRQLIIRHRNS
ncbi:EamA family transporter [uncultured Muribaculum sp.]|uniref:EamA family transporter n=1 Tax=uncultured Muribaculum sp. TaxID=1918613 RepID=UPI002591C6E6|nr:EamA family transporter [uncultured Muribaculum sp.]